MADTKITALSALTAADPANDVLPIVDVNDPFMAASGTTKKISINNILGASGTATLASATVSGDLTVDTSTLKVDSANDRVGIGTASPAQFVHLSKSNTSTALTAPPVGGASLRIQNTSSTNNNFGSVEFYNAAGLFGGSVNCQFTNQATPTNDLVFVTRGSSGGLEHYRIAADGVCTWSEVGGVAGTAMTLNATGLGVGASPSFKLDVAGAANSAPITLLRLNNTGTTGGGPGIAARLQFNAGATALGFVQGCNFASGSIGVQISGDGTNIHQTIDSSGNVGIGVTPSANRLQIAGNVGLPNTCTASGETSGVFSIDVANLLSVAGGLNVRRAAILMTYVGVDGAGTNATTLQTLIVLEGFNTWATISKNDIVGTASVAVSGATATSATITVTVPTGNAGTVHCTLLGGPGSTTRPSMTINA